MKILAIGGSGGMGRFAVDAAQHFDSVERIVVADLNESSAQDFAAQLNNKVSSMGLDVSDDVALRKAMLISLLGVIKSVLREELQMFSSAAWSRSRS